ncbi:MAG: ribonuclease P protein component 1 [Promethearchaeota archaeon]
MQYTSRLALRPLIGLSAIVKQATNPTLHRITGVIVDDTQNMLTLFDGHRTRHVPKTSSLFELSLPNGETVEIPGKALLGHPAERLRRAKKLQW